jgi:hypothetical protein
MRKSTQSARSKKPNPELNDFKTAFRLFFDTLKNEFFEEKQYLLYLRCKELLK